MSYPESRISIISGADVSATIRLKNQKTRDPLDLTDATKIQFKFDTRNRDTLTIDNSEVPAVKAQILYSGVTFIAQNAGANGNDIILQFDGISDIDTVIGVWNTANPTNQVTFTGGLGTDVLPSSTVRLTDGYDAYFPVSVVGDPLLGKVKIALLESQTKLLKRGPNQSFLVTIDYGTFPGGNRIKGFFDKLDVLDD